MHIAVAGCGPRRLIVLGAGALGSLFGAQLASQRPVVLVGRAEHVTAIQQTGLQVVGGDGCGRETTRTVKVAAQTGLPALEAGDAVMVFAKTGDTVLAGQQIAAALVAGAPELARRIQIWTLQNGIDNVAALEAVFAQALPVTQQPAVQVAVTSQGATLLSPGRVADFGGGTIFADTPIGCAMGELCAQAGLTVRYTADMRAALWRKLAMNCVVNPLTFLLQRRNRYILTPELAGLRATVMGEVAAVAAAEGVKLDTVELILSMEAAMRVSENYSSMYQDRLRHQARQAAWQAGGAVAERRPILRTEIADLTGAVLARAKRHGIAVPANETLFQLVRFHEANCAPAGI